MTRSRQQIVSSAARSSVRQHSDAADAEQLVEDVTADSIHLRVQSMSIDLAALAVELARLRSAMRPAAETPEHDVALGEVAAAERAAQQGNRSEALARLKAAGRWALETAEKVGVGVAAGAIKTALGL